MAMTIQELLLVGICFFLVGLILGLLFGLFLWHATQPGRRYALKKKRSLSYAGDVRAKLGVLQQLQAMIGQEAAKDDPGLGDLVRFIRSMQRAFGRRASLEGVIQTLVAQDIARQLAQQQRIRCEEKAIPIERQVVA